MKKFSKKYIYYHLLLDFLIIIFFIFFFGFSAIGESTENPEDITFMFTNPVFIGIAVGFFIVGYSILTIYHFLYYKCSSYELNDKGIICNRGVLFKKKSILEYNKIHSINIKQNFIQKIFKLSTLLVDSGSANTAYSAEITIYEDENIVNELELNINKRQKEINIDTIDTIKDKKEENIYLFTNKYKLLYCVLNLLVVTTVVLFTLALGIIVYFVLIIVQVIDLKDSITVLLYFPLTLLLFDVLSFIFTMIVSYINFYDFKIYKRDDSISISYGLLEKKSNSFKLDKVKAVIVKQDLIQRIFKFASIDVEVIGYGEIQKSKENTQIKRYLIPLCKVDEVNDYINLIFPKYIPIKKESKAKSYFSLVSWKLLIPVIFASLVLIIANLWIYPFLDEVPSLIYFFTLIPLGALIVWLSCVLITEAFAYHAQGVEINDNKITIYHGSLTRKMTVILKENLIGITKITTPKRKNKGIYNYIIHFKSNSKTNTVLVTSQDKEIYEKIINLLYL